MSALGVVALLVLVIDLGFLLWTIQRGRRLGR